MPRDDFIPPTLTLVRTGAEGPMADSLRTAPPLLFVHVPKCAGTTFDLIMGGLARVARRPAIRFSGTIYGQGFGGLDKTETREEAAGFAFPEDWFFASGHIPAGRFPPHGGNPNTVCFVREPVSRLIALFRMGARRNVWEPSAAIEAVFEAGLLSPNSMVRQLCGEISKDVPLGSSHVDMAVRNFNAMTYTGRMEDFDAVLGAILADYKVRYVAYHSCQVGEPIADAEYERLSAEAAPYVELDRAFYEQIDRSSRSATAGEQVSVRDIPPGTPVFLASPFLASGDGEPGLSRFVVSEQLWSLCGD